MAWRAPVFSLPLRSSALMTEETAWVRYTHCSGDQPLRSSALMTEETVEPGEHAVPDHLAATKLGLDDRGDHPRRRGPAHDHPAATKLGLDDRGDPSTRSGPGGPTPAATKLGLDDRGDTRLVEAGSMCRRAPLRSSALMTEETRVASHRRPHHHRAATKLGLDDRGDPPTTMPDARKPSMAATKLGLDDRGDRRGSAPARPVGRPLRSSALMTEETSCTRVGWRIRNICRYEARP